MKSPTPLKLVALDSEDLAIISAHVQDAVLMVRDLVWTPGRKRFALGMNRFVWEIAVDGQRTRQLQRRRAALHFDRVLTARTLGFDRSEPRRVLDLLALEFVPSETPAGDIRLIFAVGAEIRLTVECIEAQLADLGAAWQTKALPVHDIADGQAAASRRIPE